MHTATYNSPVDKLLTYLALEAGKKVEWVNYPEMFGFKPEDIPELIRMATDTQLTSEEADDLEFSAPVHAIRALEQLHAEAAAEPLMHLFDVAVDNEWIQSELVRFYGGVGPNALPLLRAHLADATSEMYSRSYAGNCIAEIGMRHLEARIESIAILTEQLGVEKERFSKFNAFIVCNLINMKAVEVAPDIKRALDGEYVDESICGKWEYVEGALEGKEISFTLPKSAPQHKGKKSNLVIIPPREGDGPRPLSAPKGAKNKSTKKSKAKMEKASRRQNRDK